MSTFMYPFTLSDYEKENFKVKVHFCKYERTLNFHISIGNKYTWYRFQRMLRKNEHRATTNNNNTNEEFGCDKLIANNFLYLFTRCKQDPV